MAHTTTPLQQTKPSPWARVAADRRARAVPPSTADFGLTLVLLTAAYLALFVPTGVRLANSVWQTEEQGHGPIILAVCAWLLYQRRHALAALPAPAGWRSRALGWALLACSLVLYAFGRSQLVLLLEAASQIVFLAGLLLLFKGRAGLRLGAFFLFFMIFTLPLPDSLVAAVTTPLKLAVSSVAATALHHAGYPIGQSGVMLTVGPYQVLVADACAGLNSMFMLEAVVILYVHLMGYPQRWRNSALLLAAIPIAFFANVVRVLVLVLLIYHLGDQAAQTFMHGVAGILLFVVALILTAMLDTLLGLFSRRQGARHHAAG